MKKQRQDLATSYDLKDTAGRWTRCAAFLVVAISAAAYAWTQLPPSAAPVAVAAGSQADAPRLASPAEHAQAESAFIQLCQACEACPPQGGPNWLSGVDCRSDGRCCEQRWDAMRPNAIYSYAQGDYVGHARAPHVAEYRIRVDDTLELVYRATREETGTPYRLNVGDVVRVEVYADPTIDRDHLIQPDGTITLKLVGAIKAAGRTVPQLREVLEQAFSAYLKTPVVTVVPITVDTKLKDLLASVDSRFGVGGQTRRAVVTPEGTIALPAIGNVCVQGLTLDEVKRELDARYVIVVPGVEITPVLVERAPRFIYVLGEVKTPGRYTLEGPTTVMQAISLAGGWNIGGNLRQIVIFRRADDWRLVATKIDVRGAVFGRDPCPADELWLNDSDIVLIPKSPILITNNVIEMVFTRGIYGIVPMQVAFNISRVGAL